mgnify:CR=1 FL=1
MAVLEVKELTKKANLKNVNSSAEVNSTLI